jgi:hypothetical protein
METINQYLTKRQKRFARAIMKESSFYQAHKAELLEKYRDKFVAIRNGKVIGVGSNSARLKSRVWAKYGHVPILFKQVLEREPRYFVPHAKLLPYDPTIPD